MADNNFSLINFDGLGDLAKSLLDKISNAVGWIVTRETPKRVAVQSYIEDIKKSDFDPVTKAVLISNAKKTIAEYSNQRSIVQHAIENMKETAKPDQIDNDWLLQFMDKSGRVSDSDFQLIWGRILAEECNVPGSVPRSLLHILERMDRNDAERFSALCSFSVFVDDGGKIDYTPVVIQQHVKDYYAKSGIDYNALVDLSALGLIEINMGFLAPGYCSDYSCDPIDVQYFGKHYLLPPSVKELSVGNVIFTKTGQALRHAIEPEKKEDFFEQFCIPFWESHINQEKPKDSYPPQNPHHINKEKRR